MKKAFIRVYRNGGGIEDYLLDEPVDLVINKLQNATGIAYEPVMLFRKAKPSNIPLDDALFTAKCAFRNTEEIEAVAINPSNCSNIELHIFDLEKLEEDLSI